MRQPEWPVRKKKRKKTWKEGREGSSRAGISLENLTWTCSDFAQRRAEDMRGWVWQPRAKPKQKRTEPCLEFIGWEILNISLYLDFPPTPLRFLKQNTFMHLRRFRYQDWEEEARMKGVAQQEVQARESKSKLTIQDGEERGNIFVRGIPIFCMTQHWNTDKCIQYHYSTVLIWNICNLQSSVDSVEKSHEEMCKFAGCFLPFMFHSMQTVPMCVFSSQYLLSGKERLIQTGLPLFPAPSGFSQFSPTLSIRLFSY